MPLPDSSRSVGICKLVDSCQKVRHEVWGGLAATSPAEIHTFICSSENTSRTMPWAHGGVTPDGTEIWFGKT